MNLSYPTPKGWRKARDQSMGSEWDEGLRYGGVRPYKRHDFVGNPRTLEWLLGRRPTTFEEFATKAHADLSAGKALRG